MVPFVGVLGIFGRERGSFFFLFVSSLHQIERT